MRNGNSNLSRLTGTPLARCTSETVMETEVQLMAEELRGKRIAALVENGFEQSELLEPKKALEQAGAKVDIVSPQTSQVKGWHHQDWGRTVSVDRQLDQANADDYDALLLPGGVMNPDR